MAMPRPVDIAVAASHMEHVFFSVYKNGGWVDTPPSSFLNFYDIFPNRCGSYVEVIGPLTYVRYYDIRFRDSLKHCRRG